MLVMGMMAVMVRVMLRGRMRGRSPGMIELHGGGSGLRGFGGFGQRGIRTGPRRSRSVASIHSQRRIHLARMRPMWSRRRKVLEAKAGGMAVGVAQKVRQEVV